MYICVCSAVTERDIHRAAATGHTTLRALRKELGVCSDCGRCGKCAKEVLKEALQDSRPSIAQATAGTGLAFA